MRVGLAVHSMTKSDVVNVLGHVRQHAADRFAAFASWYHWPGTFHQVSVLALKRGKPFFPGQRFAIPLLQRRLVLPQIHVGGGPGTKDLQNASRLGPMMCFSANGTCHRPAIG